MSLKENDNWLETIKDEFVERVEEEDWKAVAAILKSVEDNGMDNTPFWHALKWWHITKVKKAQGREEMTEDEAMEREHDRQERMREDWEDKNLNRDNDEL